MTEANKMNEDSNNDQANPWLQEQPEQYKQGLKLAQKKGKKRKRWGFPEVLLSLAAMIALFSIYMIILMINFFTQNDVKTISSPEESLEKLTLMLQQPVWMLTGNIPMYLAWGLGMWYASKFLGSRSWAKDFWVRFKLPKDILIGVGFGVLAFGLVQGISQLLVALGVNMDAASNTGQFDGLTGIWKYVMFFGIVTVIGPLFEELFFRGFLMQAFIRNFRRGNVHEPRSSFGWNVQQNSAATFAGYLAFRNFCYRHKYILAAILSSFAFGMMHFIGSWVTVGVTGLLGLSFALLTLKTRRLAPAIFAHITYNGIVSATVLFLM